MCASTLSEVAPHGTREHLRVRSGLLWQAHALHAIRRARARACDSGSLGCLSERLLGGGAQPDVLDGHVDGQRGIGVVVGEAHGLLRLLEQQQNMPGSVTLLLCPTRLPKSFMHFIAVVHAGFERLLPANLFKLCNLLSCSFGLCLKSIKESN